jgi:hypothetical protein
MSFTNDDLKRLKELHEECAEMACDIIPLLARLEAAETVCNLLVGPGVIHPLVKAWRRSCGEEE